MRRPPRFVYLASASPRRAALLAQIGIRFEPLVAEADEDSEALEALEPRESAKHYVQRVTALKAGAAILRRRDRGLPEAPILTADTTVVLARRILGKPEDRRDARAMLRQLQGSAHRVLTAVAVTDGRRLELVLSESRVTVGALSEAQIAAYVASGECDGKAGAYGIQGRAAAFVSSIKGSYSGIMGLPLYETAALLARFGVHADAAG